ncbi:MAG: hypothetical protein ACK4RK_21980 [Gemmataceae bacterium]
MARAIFTGPTPPAGPSGLEQSLAVAGHGFGQGFGQGMDDVFTGRRRGRFLESMAPEGGFGEGDPRQRILQVLQQDPAILADENLFNQMMARLTPQVAEDPREIRLLHAIGVDPRSQQGQEAVLSSMGAKPLELERYIQAHDRAVAAGDPLRAAAYSQAIRKHAGFLEEERIRRSGGPSAVVTITQQEESEFAKTIGREQGKQFVEILNDSAKARERLTELKQMRDRIASGDFETGILGGTRQNLGRLAEFLNVPDNVKQAIGSAKTAEEIQSISNRIALQYADSLSRMTNLSIDMIQKAVPNLMNTPEGNLAIIDSMMKMDMMRIEEAGLAQAYVAENRSLTGYEALRGTIWRDDPEIAKMEMLLREAARAGITTGRIRQSLGAGTDAPSNAPPIPASVRARYPSMTEEQWQKVWPNLSDEAKREALGGQ